MVNITLDENSHIHLTCSDYGLLFNYKVPELPWEDHAIEVSYPATGELLDKIEIDRPAEEELSVKFIQRQTEEYLDESLHVIEDYLEYLGEEHPPA